jgi:hypothetical protein
MNRLFNFAKVQPIPAGVYHRQSAPADTPPYRIHLRMQPDGSGVLVLNASTVMHLNSTAAEYAYHFVKGTEGPAAAREVAKRYRVSRSTALRDFEDFAGRIDVLLSSQDVDPVAYLDFERVAPHSATLTAPLRVDCALTYRLPEDAVPGLAPGRRVDRELSTAEWVQVLDNLWQVGVPHITFTGGEPTLRDDLAELVHHAELTGQVCGLLTDGLKLADGGFRSQILMSGLDHILMLLQPGKPESWKALESLLPEDVFVTVHLTVNRENAESANSHLEKLARLGVKAVSLSFAAPELPATELAGRAASLGLELKYDLPVPYSADNPVARETSGEMLGDGAGRAWLYIEPDGDVLPSQGQAASVLGNILHDPWEGIYRL